MSFTDLLPIVLAPMVERLLAAGATPILVGGAVRDRMLGRESKDLDIEVYGLSVDALAGVLAPLGSVHAVGKCFGVLKLRLDGYELDISLPRRDRKVGQGHRGFEVDYDPAMTYVEAASRRDFTINSMGVNLATCELLDPWGGEADLKAGVLRHISDAFSEDPLRVLRACQFAARFGFSIAPETVFLCRSLETELPSLSSERVWGEFRKLLLKAEHPSVGLRALQETGALSLFPELAALQGVPQNPRYHPEGDVWIHNNLVIDACAAICRERWLEADEALVILLAALCHDLGKPATTRLEDGQWRAIGHEEAGEAPTRCVLGRMGCPPSWVDGIVALVREHTRPLRLWDQHQLKPVSDGAIRRLALKVPLRQLNLVALADFRGRTSADAGGPCEAVEWLSARAAQLAVADAAPKPLLQGRDLQQLGIAPGPAMGKLLKSAFEAQLDGEYNCREEGLNWLRSQLSQFSPH
ncbi:MAG: HD domain-containing protein [Methylococcaceae bacterium]|nr:HD domain-containing protein [Methylococcaceae bacterium]